MASADVVRLDAAPTRRQDIISAILSDYGDLRDSDADADADADEHDGDGDVDLDAYYTQAEASPAANRPLPPLTGFQLRRGGCSLLAAVRSDILAPGAPCGKHRARYFRHMAIVAV